MPKFIIKGGKKLSGELKVGGAKNSALKIIPASILSTEQIIISNLPNIEDVDRSLEVLSDLGAIIKRQKGSVSINTKHIRKTELSHDMANKFRGSIMFVGPMLARFGKVKFPHPGGCVIGAGGRPIDLFLDGYKAFGAEIKEEPGYYSIKANKLKPANFFFPLISVTATESMMMTASIIPGKTILKNCAMEPEIEALANYLNKQGASIKGAGTPTIIIEGRKNIKAGKFSVIPDRIETGSFAILAAAANANIKIKNCIPDHIMTLLSIFKKIGVNFTTGKDWIQITPSNKPLKPYDVKTHEYPGFATDLQSPYVVLMTQAKGTSIVHETIYDRRLLWTDMLSQMGANIVMCDPHRVVIQGPSKLKGKHLFSPDLRAGIALVIAALIANGKTEIDNIYQIDRGYENLDTRLRAVGADISRVE